MATTLIFTSTVSGNYANYLSYKRDEAAAAGAAGGPSPSGAAAPAGDQKVWYYDINKVRRPQGRFPSDTVCLVPDCSLLSDSMQLASFDVVDQQRWSSRA